MNKIFFLLFLIILCSSCKDNTKTISKSDFEVKQDSLSNSLNDIHKQGHINGFGVAIVDENGILYNEGFGFSQMAEKKSYQRNTIQNIGSVSKTLIGVALLKAQELGKLSLDDPINKYLPFVVANPKFPEDTITIRHLATHSSSIVDNEFYNGKAYVLKENEKLPNDIGIDEVFNPSDSKRMR